MEPKVALASEKTLDKLESHKPLTEKEIERIRQNFIAEDNRTWLAQYAYNALTKTAIVVTAIVSILTAYPVIKGFLSK